MTDRIRASAVPAARAELDETLRRILATPSLAVQLLPAPAGTTPDRRMAGGDPAAWPSEQGLRIGSARMP
ncbi:hypothetical protein ACIGJO_08425 [Streptomyces sp. NPDC079020]|uniref:hypothetical protein n=1 Tax=Streptomyces sp. NPDC079020 TaxID=3365722 RepID=UPI0037D76A5B